MMAACVIRRRPPTPVRHRSWQVSHATPGAAEFRLRDARLYPVIRRMLNAMVTLGVIGVVVVFAARVAEPSVRPILYPVSASPVTLVASVAVEVASPVEASQTSSVDTASTTTSVASVATTLAATTTVPTTTTTTVAPVDEVAVLTASYAWGRSTDAAVLQQVLGVEADGWYGPATRAAHVAENQARGLPVDAVATAPTTTTTVAPTTTVPPTTTVAPTTTVPPTTTVAPTPTVPPTTTVAVPTTTVPPPSTTAGMFGNLGAQLMAQLLGQPCIADGDLSDCGPEVDALVRGLVG